MAKNSFLLYYNQNEIFNELTDEEAGKLIKAVFDYEINGSVSKDKFTRALMIPIKQVLDKNKEEYEIICERNKKTRFLHHAHLFGCRMLNCSRLCINLL